MHYVIKSIYYQLLSRKVKLKRTGNRIYAIYPNPNNGYTYEISDSLEYGSFLYRYVNK